MSILDDFSRVKPGCPCPKCGRFDWCLVGRPRTRFENYAICKRVKSDRPWGDAGWLHGDLPPRLPVEAERDPKPNRPERTPEWIAEFVQESRTVGGGPVSTFASRLGLTRESLVRLGAGTVTPRQARQNSG